MNNLSYHEAIPTNDWKGVLSLPRELKLKKYNNDYYLKQNPIKELDELKTNIESILEHDLTNDFNCKLDFDPFEINFQADINPKDKLNVNLIRGNNLKINLLYDRKNKEIVLKRSFSIDKKIGQFFNDTHTAVIEDDQENIDIQLIMDRSTLEIFINEGEVVFSDLIFPENDGSTIFSIITDSKEGKVYDLNVNKLESIWS